MPVSRPPLRLRRRALRHGVPQAERQIGRKEAEELEQTVGLVRERRIVEYVVATGARLARAAGRSDIAWQWSVGRRARRERLRASRRLRLPRVVDINALSALAPLPRAPVPRPSRPAPHTAAPLEPQAQFRARLDETSNVSNFVESSIAGMPPRLIMRLQLVVEELFVNTVTYGHGGDSEAPVDVSVCIDADRVTLVYEDNAPAFNPFAKVESPDPAASLETRSVGHLGVFLITQLAERCDYARTANRNRVTVELPVR